jgi:hypothetical protein
MKNIDSFKWEPEHDSQHKNKATPQPYFLNDLSGLREHLNILVNKQHNRNSQDKRLVKRPFLLRFKHEDDSKIS